MESTVRKYIVFGAGHDGRELLHHLSEGVVSYFCDNDENLWGDNIEGIPIISPEQLKEIHNNYIVVIALNEKSYVRKQLEMIGIKDYILYISDSVKSVIGIRRLDIYRKEDQKSIIFETLDKLIQKSTNQNITTEHRKKLFDKYNYKGL